VFTYIFIVGALLMNLSIIIFVGTDTDTSCMLRPWTFNVSATIMFAPLLMKLLRVFRLLNNPTLKKMKISDTTVAMQTFGLVLVDLIILVLWSIIDTPKLVTVSTSYTSVLANVNDTICSTANGGYVTFEIIMMIWKASLLFYGVYMVRLSINTRRDNCVS
jgi:hypothetical protein